MTHEKRSRTGCLSCRARRIKCDERKPMCKRCETANVVCSGYPKKRHVEPQRLPRAQTDTSIQQPDLGSNQSLHDSTYPSQTVATGTGACSFQNTFEQSSPGTTRSYVREDGMPLVALPRNPRPGDRPCADARQVLGYHQTLFRTLLVLFPTDDLWFWRDELCEEAWGREYIFLTLTALGNMHRAALMTSMPQEIYQRAGEDLKINAFQIYSKALDELSLHLVEAKETPRLLVAVLCLMAYFESFGGNITAFMRHVHAAMHYMSSLVLERTGLDADRTNPPESTPLETCLRALQQMCHIAVPIATFLCNTPGQLPPPRLDSKPQNLPVTNLAVLRDLDNLVSFDIEIEQLIWNPLIAHHRDVSAAAINTFQEKLLIWRSQNEHLLPELNSEFALENTLKYKWDRFPIPPPAYSSISPAACLAAAHYSFFMARLNWALVLLGKDGERNELSAKFYFYEALRFAATSSNTDASFRAKDAGDSYIPCEALNAGYLAMLHITGLCSPLPMWLQWIQSLCVRIEQEGILKGHTFSTNLDCLYTFEMHSQVDSPATIERFPDPGERIICQLVPETDGRHYTSYFARTIPETNLRGDNLLKYHVLGHARWKCHWGEHPCEPIIEHYDERMIITDSLVDWLVMRQPVLSWKLRSGEVEFNMDQALRDHINGTRLLPASDEMQA